MAVENGKLYTAIVLQGGGALGAYEYGVLKALYKARPGFKPAAVAGISIGAVTAAVLGGSKDPIDALKRLWQDKLTVTASLAHHRAIGSLSGELRQPRHVPSER